MQNIIRNIIRKEIDLLFEAFEMNNKNKTYTPTTDVSKTSQIALESIFKAQQNGVKVASIDEQQNQGSGRNKAKQLSQRNPQSFMEMKKLKSFFETNSSKVEEERRNLGIIQQRRGTLDEMIKSNTLLVWNLHGGDAGKKWVNSQLSNTHEQGVDKKKRMRIAGGDSPIHSQNKGLGSLNHIFDPRQQRINR